MDIRGLVVAAAGGAAIIAAGLSGCSSDDKKPEVAPSSATASSVAAGDASAAGAEVTVDGEDQKVEGTVVCSTMGGNMNIAIGGATAGIAAVVSQGDSPTVQSVGLGSLDGVALGYQSGAGQGEAKAVKDGNTYTITGTATGVDMANPMQPLNKPFEIKVTCP